MRKVIIYIVLVLVICNTAYSQLIPQHFIFSNKIPEKFDAQRLNRIDTVFKKLVDTGVLPHAVTFIAYDGKVIHNKAYGWRSIENKTACTTSDIFRMASQTKAIAVVALMTYFEEGKFLLDEPIKKYIPEFGNPQVAVSFNAADTTFETRPAKSDITIRQLLTHTSGITYGNANSRKYYEKIGIPTGSLLTNEPKTLGEVVKLLAKCPLEFDPGEKFTYGMGIDVIGYLTEIISGKTIDKVLKERIFDPIGMTETQFVLPQQKENRLVTLYQNDQNLNLKVNPNKTFQSYSYAGAQTFFSTGGGLCGTIQDYAKFLQMILNGGEFNGHRILSRKTIEMLYKNQVGDKRGEAGFGLAFEIYRKEYSYRTMISEGALHWGGMFGTDYIIDPKENMILLVYANMMPNQTGINYYNLFYNLVYQSIK